MLHKWVTSVSKFSPLVSTSMICTYMNSSLLLSRDYNDPSIWICHCLTKYQSITSDFLSTSHLWTSLCTENFIRVPKPKRSLCVHCTLSQSIPLIFCCDLQGRVKIAQLLWTYIALTIHWWK